MEEYGVKYNNLINYLKSMGKVAVAFSGGVDSSLLLKIAQNALGDNILAISIKTAYVPSWEIEEAVNFTRKHGISHRVYEFPFLNQLKDNPKDRCYTCKYYLFKSMLEQAANEGYSIVLDGTNADDIKDYRPGLQALIDLQIKSPFLELKYTKSEIRALSQKMGLPTWDKPAYACLLTRIPYDQEVTPALLRRIEQAEKFMHNLGFKDSRVRAHGNLARLEVARNDMEDLFTIDMFHRINVEFKALGFTYVTLDMEGYRMGSLNEAL
jgi:uncharacterized protein